MAGRAQTTCHRCLGPGMFFLVIHCNYKLTDLRGLTKANAGQWRPTTANESQRGPTKANTSPRQPTQATYTTNESSRLVHVLFSAMATHSAPTPRHKWVITTRLCVLPHQSWQKRAQTTPDASFVPHVFFFFFLRVFYILTNNLYSV